MRVSDMSLLAVNKEQLSWKAPSCSGREKKTVSTHEVYKYTSSQFIENFYLKILTYAMSVLIERPY